MKIKLGGKRGGFALVDKDDYYQLIDFSWYMDKQGYICSSINNKIIKMHRFIMNFPKGKLVDHINKKKYDNRRCNLRLINNLGNGQNKKISKNNTTGYRGVVYGKKEKKYKTQIRINKKYIYLGSYNTAEEAAEQIDMYLVHNKIEYIDLNFPDKKKEYLKRKYVPFVSKRKNNIIKYIGVEKKGGYCRARINHNGKVITILSSKDTLECANAYDKYIVENNIPNKKLNFPENYPSYEKLLIKTKYDNIKGTDKIIRLICASCRDAKIIIDKEDYDKIKYYSWNTANGGYVTTNATGQYIRMSRLIMGVKDPNIYIDHKDRNKLNNTKENLRLSDENKNARGKTKMKGTTSKYLGITYDKNSKRWYINITIKNICINLGTDKIEEYAARRRDLFVLEYLPDEHIGLNFDWTNDDIINWKKKLVESYIITNKNQQRKQYLKQINKYINIIMDALMDDDLEKVKIFNSVLNYKIHIRNIN